MATDEQKEIDNLRNLFDELKQEMVVTESTKREIDRKARTRGERLL